MIKRFYSILILLVLPFIILFLFPLKANAEVIFEDNFNSYPEGSFPSRWTEVFETCSIDWIVKDGKAYSRITNKSYCLSNIIPNDTVWPEPLSNYVFEADVRFGVGTDHNLVYRSLADGRLYEFHFQIPGGFTFGFPGEGQVIHSRGGLYFSGVDYHMKVIVDGTNIKAYIDDSLVREVELENPTPPGKIALRIGTGADSNAETWFDNVKVTTLDHEDGILPVPLFKQTDPLWSDDIYDTASRWALDPSFSRWGCAVTSAAMVFSYNGLKRMEDGGTLTPGALNEWLKSQPDGYVGDGLTNWMALARLSKRIADENGVSFDALDYKKVWSSDNQVVRDGIDNNLPSILQVPGHFVAATGYDDENIYINDPFYSRDDLTQYGNTFENISQFVPSNTDLSAMMIVADKDMELSVRDSTGEIIGAGRIQEPIVDPNDPSVVSSAKASSIVEIFDPASGEYEVELSGGIKGSYSFQVYLYDKEGDVKVLSFEGTMIGDSVVYNLTFNKKDSRQSMIQEEVSFESILNGLKLLFQNGEIKNYGTYKSLSERFENARKFSNNLSKTKIYLENIKESVDQSYKTGKISSLSNDYLIGRIDVLLKNY